MTELAPACQVCGDLPTQYARAWPHETQYGTLFVCDRCRRFPGIDSGLGLMCHHHFEARRRPKSELMFCADCRAALAADRDRAQKNETIDPDQPWGQHITLTCVNHPELTWTTKNISHIGARSIFFRPPGGDYTITECSCPLGDLIVYKEDDPS